MRMPLPKHRKQLEAIGIDLSLPPWPEYMQAYADKEREENRARKATGKEHLTGDCPRCRLLADTNQEESGQ